MDGTDTPVTGSAIDAVITFACGTIYGDWNGDCEITSAELDDLRDAVLGGSSTYNPLYDSNCDGVLTAGVERTKAAANYLAQPSCDCGGESMMFGGGGSSEEEIEAVAAWFSETMSSVELAQFLVDLADAIDEFGDQPVAEDMTALLVALGE